MPRGLAGLLQGFQASVSGAEALWTRWKLRATYLYGTTMYHLIRPLGLSLLIDPPGLLVKIRYSWIFLKVLTRHLLFFFFFF